MSNRKNYNSIVFLTTLSVYLGLVLVGAPPVLAQAALTQKIEIQNEAEIKDDLDKKPDDQPGSKTEFKTNDQFIEQYAQIILTLLKKGYDPKFNDYELTAIVSDGFTEAEFEKFFPTVKDLTVGDFNYKLNKHKFVGKFNLKLKPQSGVENISWLASDFAVTLGFLREESQSKSERIILKNTQISFENKQIFLITHLPRASIDDLLADKDAQ